MVLLFPMVLAFFDRVDVLDCAAVFHYFDGAYVLDVPTSLIVLIFLMVVTCLHNNIYCQIWQKTKGIQTSSLYF